MKNVFKKHKNKVWLLKIKAYIVSQLENRRHLVISDIAAEMNMSERQFFRKMARLTGKTPNHFIQEIRMQKARQILESKRFDSIKDVALQVGFSNPDYFSKLYYHFFGLRPSSYLKHSSKMAG